MSSDSPVTLREKHAATTRNHILNEAYALLVEHPDQPFSHEAVAARAGVGARTVYRYFPAQSDLYEELWVNLRKQSGTIFPSREEDIIPQVQGMFERFEQNEKLIRAVLESPAGHRVRERGAPEGRAAFTKSLEKVTAGQPAARKRQTIAVFQAIYSAPFWEMLKTRGGLSGKDAIEATMWAMSTLLHGLRQESKSNKRGR
jgi:AcrR family transcriptional regulator